MSRLRDLESDDPVLAEAAALLRAAEPSDAAEPMQARIWRGLRTVPRRPPRLLGLRPAVAIALLLVLGALAGATVFRGWRRHRESAVAPPARGASADARHHHRARVAPSANPIEPAVIAVAPTTTTPDALVVAPPPPPTPRPRVHAIVASTPVTPEAPSHPPSALGSAPPPTAPEKLAEAPDLLLQSAMRALRFEHDPKHASELADAYLARYPDDDLVEEAMAIGIQAHEQLDDGIARVLAARYLTRFPNGRFRAAALRAR